MKKYLQDNHGDMSLYSVFFLLSVLMVMAFLFVYTSVQIQVLNLRNGIKLELNNLSAEVYADTFQSQREGNLTAYEERMNSSSTYLNKLKQSYKDGLSKKLPMETEDYKLSNINLYFADSGDGICYTFTCSAEFYISMFGGVLPPLRQEIRLTGSHRTKY